MPLFNSLVRGEPRNSGLRNFTPKARAIHSIVRCTIHYISIHWTVYQRLSVCHQRDRQTGGQTDGRKIYVYDARLIETSSETCDAKSAIWQSLRFLQLTRPRDKMRHNRSMDMQPHNLQTGLKSGCEIREDGGWTPLQHWQQPCSSHLRPPGGRYSPLLVIAAFK